MQEAVRALPEQGTQEKTVSISEQGMKKWHVLLR